MIINSWVLVIVLTVGSTTRGVSIDHIEFSTRDACVSFMHEVKPVIGKMRSMREMMLCVPKEIEVVE